MCKRSKKLVKCSLLLILLIFFKSYNLGLSLLLDNATTNSMFKSNGVNLSAAFITAINRRNTTSLFNKLISTDKVSCSNSSTNESRIVNPHAFKYIIEQPHACAENPDVVIYIHNGIEQRKRRDVIRNTWATLKQHKNVTFKVLFMLGRDAKYQNQGNIKTEAEKYHDIIQEDFIDNYDNLTYKQIMGLKWITEHCPKTQMIVKADSDALVNLYQLANFYRSRKRQGTIKNLMYCGIRHESPTRNNSKWAVTRDEYSGDTYPPFCLGSAHVISRDVAKRLYNASQHTPFLRLDDVYVTGILVDKINITKTPFSNEGEFHLIDTMRDKEKTPKALFVFLQNRTDKQLELCWRKIMGVIRKSLL